jgi:predicted ATPase
VRRGLADCREQGITCFATSYDVQLAAMKARAGYLDAALAMLDGALAEAEQTKAPAFVADGHRIRDEILLKRDPAHTEAAQEAFLALSLSRNPPWLLAKLAETLQPLIHKEGTLLLEKK